MSKKPTKGGYYEVGFRKPPLATRFAKGKSGWPQGRPRSKPGAQESVFDVIFEKRLVIPHGGQTREVTVDEGLQHALLKDAFAGNKLATREVMKMITRRERARAAAAPPPPAPTLQLSPDPDNANEALVLLGIAEASEEHGRPHLKLLPWAVQAALNRRGGANISPEKLSHVRNRMVDPDSVKWPKARG